jgi:hypothetical protein
MEDENGWKHLDLHFLLMPDSRRPERSTRARLLILNLLYMNFIFSFSDKCSSSTSLVDRRTLFFLLPAILAAGQR